MEKFQLLDYRRRFLQLIRWGLRVALVVAAVGVLALLGLLVWSAMPRAMHSNTTPCCC